MGEIADDDEAAMEMQDRDYSPRKRAASPPQPAPDEAIRRAAGFVADAESDAVTDAVNDLLRCIKERPRKESLAALRVLVSAMNARESTLRHAWPASQWVTVTESEASYPDGDGTVLYETQEGAQGCASAHTARTYCGTRNIARWMPWPASGGAS